MMPKQILKKYWGFDQFRPVQQDIVESVLNNQDTLALLPTGGGKSICFQVPALLKEGLTLVISPLIALMKDQVEGLKKKGIRAEAIFSGMHHTQVDRILDNAIYGNVKILYLSPERIKSRMFSDRLERMNVDLIAVDEAHCISQWGIRLQTQLSGNSVTQRKSRFGSAGYCTYGYSNQTRCRRHSGKAFIQSQ